MLKFLVILTFVPAILARTPVRPCSGGLPLPDAVFFDSRESPCLEPPCNVVRSAGTGVTYVEFTPRNDANSILPRVRGTSFRITVTQPLPQEIQNNPCIILEEPHSCPLAAGEPVSYRLEMPVESSTPLVTADTEITLFGDNNEVIFCYQLQTRVVA